MDETLVGDTIAQLSRIANKFNALQKKPVDFGTGDILYPSEIHAIEAIGKGYGRTVTEIGKRFGITKGAVSQVIGKLSRKGYVEKTRGSENAKEVLLSLTPRGSKAFRAHESLHKRMDKEMIELASGYSLDEIALIKGILERLENQIEKYIELDR